MDMVIEFERCEAPAPCIIKGIEPASDKRPCIGYQSPKRMMSRVRCAKDVSSAMVRSQKERDYDRRYIKKGN